MVATRNLAGLRLGENGLEASVAIFESPACVAHAVVLDVPEALALVGGPVLDDGDVVDVAEPGKVLLQLVFRHGLGPDEEEAASLRLADLAVGAPRVGDHHLQRPRMRRDAAAVHRFHGQGGFRGLGELDVGNAAVLQNPDLFDGPEQVERLSKLIVGDVLAADDEQARIGRGVRLGSGAVAVLGPRFVVELSSFVVLLVLHREAVVAVVLIVAVVLVVAVVVVVVVVAVKSSNNRHVRCCCGCGSSIVQFQSVLLVPKNRTVIHLCPTVLSLKLLSSKLVNCTLSPFFADLLLLQTLNLK